MSDATNYVPRIFGTNEAQAMFSVIAGDVTSRGPAHGFLFELEAERELLLECRSALTSLLGAVGTENFGRTGRDMSTNLRAAIHRAEAALDAC